MALDAFRWLVGVWSGQHGVDQVEEYWSQPAGNAMISMFRWIHDGKPRFYELVTLYERDGEILIRLKHFHSDMVGWEEKEKAIEFVLVALSEQEAIFWQRNAENAPWMVYRREAGDRLISYFERENQPPVESDMFIYQRASL